MILTRPRLYFTIDGTPSATFAWDMKNLLELAKPAKRRGTAPVIIPGASGGRAQPLRADVTERVVSGQVYGRLDPNGLPHPSEIEGLTLNLATLIAAWVAVPVTDDSTRTCVLHLPSGTTKTGPVQVLDFDYDFADMPIVANVIMRLLLPEGELS